MSVIKSLGFADKTRRNFLLTSSVVGLLGGCGHARFFELAWHEEVALPAGGSVWVYVKTTYERMSNAWDEYSGLVPRDTYMEFDSGGAAGRVGQLFKGYWPIFLGRDGADWYAVISGGPYVVEKNKMGAPLTSKESGQDWEMFSNSECLKNSKGNWVVLSRDRWVPHPGGLVSDQFKFRNFLNQIDDVRQMASLNGLRIDLSMKNDWNERHPYSDRTLSRPTC